MGILLRVIKAIFFVAVILAIGQIQVGSKRIAEHFTHGAGLAWKSGPEHWVKEGAAHIESDSVRDWLKKLGIEIGGPAHSKRATKPRPVVDDIADRDRAEMKKLLDKEMK